MSHASPENGNTAENIFKILNQVLETGTPATVVLKDKLTDSAQVDIV